MMDISAFTMSTVVAWSLVQRLTRFLFIVRSGIMLKGKARAVREFICEGARRGTAAKFWKLRVRAGEFDLNERVLLMNAV